MGASRSDADDRRGVVSSRPDHREAIGDPDTEDQGDFAEEHNDTTVGEGPKAPGVAGKESESPRGLGGMDLPERS